MGLFLQRIEGALSLKIREQTLDEQKRVLKEERLKP